MTAPQAQADLSAAAAVVGLASSAGERVTGVQLLGLSDSINRSDASIRALVVVIVVSAAAVLRHL